MLLLLLLLLLLLSVVWFPTMDGKGQRSGEREMREGNFHHFLELARLFYSQEELFDCEIRVGSLFPSLHGDGRS